MQYKIILIIFLLVLIFFLHKKHTESYINISRCEPQKTSTNGTKYIQCKSAPQCYTTTGLELSVPLDPKLNYSEENKKAMRDSTLNQAIEMCKKSPNIGGSGKQCIGINPYSYFGVKKNDVSGFFNPATDVSGAFISDNPWNSCLEIKEEPWWTADSETYLIPEYLISPSPSASPSPSPSPSASPSPSPLYVLSNKIKNVYNWKNVPKWKAFNKSRNSNKS